MNTAFMFDGVFVEIEKNAQIASPIVVRWIASEKSEKTLFSPRLFLKAGAHSKATIVERFESEKPNTTYLTNAVVESTVGEGAILTHYRVQQESLKAFHISSIRAEIEQNSSFLTHTFSFGSQLARNDVQVRMNGANCQVIMNGLSALQGDQHVANSTLLDHAKPHCESHELYKGIYGGTSEGVFSGTIIVREDAQKTNAIQSNRSLLLTDTATVNTRPQLKIWADDVKCTHGATIGQLDLDGMFYLRSRGISEVEAKNLLIHAFASEVIATVDHDGLRVELEELLSEKLSIVHN